MKVQIGDSLFDISNGRYLDVKKVEVGYDEDGRAYAIRITKRDGSQFIHKDDGQTVPMTSGTLPVGVYDISADLKKKQ